MTTVVVTVPASGASSPASSPTSGADQGSDDDSSKGVGTSTIIGLSVAGGIALIGIIAFVIWKFTRKRNADDFDDGEAIKWPELNAHGENPHALPTQRGDNAGFETNSQVNLTRPDSRAGSFAPSAAASAVDLYAPNAAQDPGAFYDPYSGPVPQAFSDGDNVSIAGGEAIPMTQINRTRSPAPPMGYDPGRRSPGPQMAYDAGRRSPGPQAAYLTDQTGRSSPSPRAMSPGPGMALAGRASPGPQAAYGYGGGAPPGLHQGY
ncbi:hypothetical protein PsYK624_124460 [Phanerochaete sordida]|uniref:Uncharacterized protein n=1 Tax=Phanerochaete sordida TaxID=48140 RepID=A0A9P3LJI4_9APHY|nr:hypothetical protein PsYK624_124460 [Phanerochaete sordida]